MTEQNTPAVKTVQDVYETLTDEQKDVVHFMIGAALEASTVANQTSGSTK